ncbi:GCN5-related N-acetyltransferase (modular protein) [Parafrankia sp. Ea1.12]|uniref:GNAT family N-acetyltransferase n=1 Tax=Parafrankia sp. Ea1.12 TaxID=573499 RepID=UPI000DA435D0|nr:GNAT family N-acetyltransferase [Parafrankia sp. Ea1.12]SQD99409.1 GCN5-related N-acetyltransferase (modular protein) [Parafrankia sp. Ea1.12]
MRVRRGVIGDAEQVAKVHVLAWQAGYRGLLPQPLLDGLHPAQRLPRWTTTLSQATWPTRGTLVAADAGDILGFADLCPTQNDDQEADQVGEILSFYVLPAAWGQGVGRHLMAAAMDTFDSAGFTSATLWVLETNLHARRFYARLGWEPDGAVRDEIVGGAAIRDVRYQAHSSVGEGRRAKVSAPAARHGRPRTDRPGRGH